MAQLRGGNRVGGGRYRRGFDLSARFFPAGAEKHHPHLAAGAGEGQGLPVRVSGYEKLFYRRDYDADGLHAAAPAAAEDIPVAGVSFYRVGVVLGQFPLLRPDVWIKLTITSGHTPLMRSKSVIYQTHG